jgi:hypothetical protein
MVEIKIIDSETGATLTQAHGDALQPVIWDAGFYVVGHGGLVLDGFRYSPKVSELKETEE